MTTPILTTKLYIPPPRPHTIPRPHLIQRLNHGRHHKLTLISASAGFGKTTLLSQWVNNFGLSIADFGLGAGEANTIQNPQTAWLSLDPTDSDPGRFLTYLVAAVRTVIPTFGQKLLGLLQSPQPPAPESVLTLLLNEIAALEENVLLVLDDYHLLDSPQIDQALTFLLNHLPPQLHLVIATREDPNLPLPRLRGRNQLTELRTADLRFTHDEAAAFLTQTMSLNLTPADITALETRTEGWIVGLQLAAISMQGQPQDKTRFIESFTGSHHFILDYLLEEVLHQQPEPIQRFLLQTALLDRFCAPLCDAVVDDTAAPAQETLEQLRQANLFLIPLDNERRWFRYHHLFADLLRQRLLQSPTDAAALHGRASRWFEENRLETEAFHHATISQDIGRATHLLLGDWMPLQFKGAVRPVLNWLMSLPQTTLDERPVLWVMYASAISMTGQFQAVESKLQAAEATLHNEPSDEMRRNLTGHIAAIRALLAVSQQDVDRVIEQSRLALDHLHPDNLAVRTATTWKLGLAYQLQGQYTAAAQTFTQAIATSEASHNRIIHIAALAGLAQVQEAQNQYSLAAENYHQVIQLAGQPLEAATIDTHLGLARIYHHWHQLDTAQHHAQTAHDFAQLYNNPERLTIAELLLARLHITQNNPDQAIPLLTSAEQHIHQHQLTHLTTDLTTLKTLLHPQNPVLSTQHSALTSHLLLDPLTDRELEILRLIADGLSNRQICQQLHLALSTVKGHNRNLYDKLNVNRRTEAVARARELGLI